MKTVTNKKTVANGNIGAVGVSTLATFPDSTKPHVGQISIADLLGLESSKHITQDELRAFLGLGPLSKEVDQQDEAQA